MEHVDVWGAVAVALVTIISAIAALFKIMQRTYTSMLEKQAVAYDTMIENLTKQNTSQQTQIDKLSEKAHIIWDFQMRRAQAEILMKKQAPSSPEVATASRKEEVMTASMTLPKSKFTIPSEVAVVLEQRKADLQDLYNGLTAGVSDPDAMLDIERHFGDWLVENICIPFRIKDGECLIYALIMAKGG